MQAAAQDAAGELAKGAIKTVGASGMVLGNAADAAGNASSILPSVGNVVASAGVAVENVAKSAEEVAKSAGEVAKSAGKVGENAATVGVQASSALSNVASLANNVTIVAEQLSDRSVKAFAEYKTRSEARDKLKTELEASKNSAEFQTKDAEFKKNTEAQILKITEESQKDNLEFQEQKNKNELEAKKLEALSQKLNTELEHAKAIQENKQEIESKNNYIGTKFGYQDAKCTTKGWVKSGDLLKNNAFANYETYYFYMITGVLSNLADYWAVEFNNEPEQINKIRDGYYVYKDGIGIYKVRVMDSVKKGSIYGKTEKKIAKLDSVNYVPHCFIDRPTVKLDGVDTDPNEYSIITRIEWFKTNKKLSIGGKTKKKSKRKRGIKKGKTSKRR